MSWFKQKWDDAKKSANQLSGWSSFWGSLSQGFKQYSSIILVIGALLLFGLTLWLSLSILSSIGNTFTLLSNIHPIVAWAFLLSLIAGVIWVGWTIYKLLQKSHTGTSRRKLDTGSALDVKLFGAEGQEVLDPKVLLPALPIPDLSLSDLLQPGHRQVVSQLLHADDQASYEKALANLSAVEEQSGEEPGWMLARAHTFLELGRYQEASALLTEIQTRYPASREAQDAVLLELAASLEFGSLMTPMSSEELDQTIAAINKALPPSAAAALSQPLSSKQAIQAKESPTNEPPASESVSFDDILAELNALSSTQDSASTPLSLEELPATPAQEPTETVEKADDDFGLSLDSAFPDEREGLDLDANIPQIPPEAPLVRETEPPAPPAITAPTLGGVLLKVASQMEWMLEEADRYREAGEHTKGHQLLHEIIATEPSSRYALDARMRLLGDAIFYELGDELGAETPLEEEEEEDLDEFLADAFSSLQLDAVTEPTNEPSET